MTLDQPLPRLKTTHGIYTLLIIANLFMGITVLEQGRVIENQRILIKNMFYDSVHSTAVHISQAMEPKK